MADEKLNIYQKLQKARAELQKKKIKKSGENDYSNYEYFELRDFLIPINEICCDLGITPIFEYKAEIAKLKIIDSDSPESFVEFESPIEVSSLKGCNPMQNIGGTQTYARRYLYIMAFEIAEDDAIEKLEKDKDGPNARIDSSKVKTVHDLVEKTNTDINEFLKFAKAKKVEDLTNKKFAECMRLLNKKVADLEKANKKSGIEPNPEQIEF